MTRLCLRRPVGTGRDKVSSPITSQKQEGLTIKLLKLDGGECMTGHIKYSFSLFFSLVAGMAQKNG